MTEKQLEEGENLHIKIEFVKDVQKKIDRLCLAHLSEGGQSFFLLNKDVDDLLIPIYKSITETAKILLEKQITTLLEDLERQFKEI